MTEISKFYLEEIDASSNIRRACISLYYQDINPWKAVVQLALSDSIDDNYKFVALLENESEILKLAHSLHCHGQIHPILVRSSKGKTTVVAGQRRCIAMGLLEALRRLVKFGDTEDISKVQKIFTRHELSFDFNLLRKNDDGFAIDAQQIKVTDEEAEKIAFDENDMSVQISDLDWGLQFQKMLNKQNPATEKLYTYAEIAELYRKPYTFVRGRSALPLLPKEWQQKLDEGAINLTDAINYALRLRSEQSTKESVEVERPIVPEPIPAESYVVEEAIDGSVISITEPIFDGSSLVNTKDVVENIHKVIDISEEEKPEPKSWTEAVRKKRTPKRKCLSADEIYTLLQETLADNAERVKALAEVLMLDLDEAKEIAGTAQIQDN